MEISFHPYLNISAYLWGIFILLSGGFFILQRKVFDGHFPKLKIFKKNAAKKQVLLEIKNSAISIGIINLMAFGVYEAYHLGFLQINNKVPTYWPIIFTIQFFIMHTLHDAYFYWTHRWMHEIKWMRAWHLTHHKSHVPTPFSAFNFSWQEASIHGLFFVLISLLIPMHWAVFSYFYAFLFWINVFGHMNFDFWPQGLYRWFYGSLFMTPTHHSFHHEFNKMNYGLYYRFWDDYCGTLNKNTYPHFYHLKKAHRPYYTSALPEKRPLPNETIGLYFEQMEQFGEDVMINWEIDKKNLLYHHASDDGTSSLLDILSKEGIKINEGPRYTKRPALSSITKIISVLRLYSRIPHTCAVLKKTNDDSRQRQNASIYLSNDETKTILSNAKESGVNAYFIQSLSNLLSTHLQKRKQMWMIPVNTNRPGEICENEVSNVDIVFNPKKTNAVKIRALIQKEINSGMIYAGKFLFKTLEPFGRLFFVTQAWLSQYLVRRTGCFSNLGRFDLSKDIDISFCPPPQRGCCFSVGLITINNRFCLRIGVHQKVKIDLDQFSIDLKERLLKN